MPDQAFLTVSRRCLLATRGQARPTGDGCSQGLDDSSEAALLWHARTLGFSQAKKEVARTIENALPTSVSGD